MAKRKIWKQIKFEGETWEEAEARWEKVLHKRKKIILTETLLEKTVNVR